MSKTTQNTIDTLLLLALPASGKSEVRRYLASLTPEQCAQEFGLGATVQLDDFPYVHMMRRVDQELEKLNHPRVFFQAEDRSFIDPRDWGTLIALVNQDYAALQKGGEATPAQHATEWLFSRIDVARQAVGLPAAFETMATTTRDQISAALWDEARQLYVDITNIKPPTLEDKTIVIEFARGGADGSPMPLNAPFGYGYSLAQLSPEILRRASVLYVWVTPEESRRKNHERTDPNDPGSILNHGVPLSVMLNDYGCDDMTYLRDQSDRPDTLKVVAHGQTFYLPVQYFDNRQDKTSFVRADKKDWRAEDVAPLHRGLATALTKLRDQTKSAT